MYIDMLINVYHGLPKNDLQVVDIMQIKSIFVYSDSEKIKISSIAIKCNCYIMLAKYSKYSYLKFFHREMNSTSDTDGDNSWLLT